MIAVVVKIYVAWQGVEVVNGVTHCTTTHAVVGLRLYVVGININVNAIPEVIALAERECITVVVITLQHTIRVGIGN